MNILFCSVGRRAELLKCFRKSMKENSKIVATDMSKYAPALYFADKYYLVPSINSDGYIDIILDICKKEQIEVITTVIDPEIELLSKHRAEFEKIGVEVLLPYYETALVCFDKMKTYEFFNERNINTVPTYGTLDDAMEALNKKELDFPVFVKPRTGSGSVGAHKVFDVETLTKELNADKSLIVQKLMAGQDIDADVYIDTVSHKPVSIFTKLKLETKIGGANKTISFIDQELVDFIMEALKDLKFNGPIDIDFFKVDGQYYISEINPRFGGAYLHAYGAGVDFINLIDNNINSIENNECFNNYKENIAMLMYDSVVITEIDNEDN